MVHEPSLTALNPDPRTSSGVSRRQRRWPVGWAVLGMLAAGVAMWALAISLGAAVVNAFA